MDSRVLWVVGDPVWLQWYSGECFGSGGPSQAYLTHPKQIISCAYQSRYMSFITSTSEPMCITCHPHEGSISRHMDDVLNLRGRLATGASNESFLVRLITLGWPRFPLSCGLAWIWGQYIHTSYNLQWRHNQLLSHSTRWFYLCVSHYDTWQTRALGFGLDLIPPDADLKWCDVMWYDADVMWYDVMLMWC